VTPTQHHSRALPTNRPDPCLPAEVIPFYQQAEISYRSDPRANPNRLISLFSPDLVNKAALAAGSEFLQVFATGEYLPQLSLSAFSDASHHDKIPETQASHNGMDILR